MKRLGDQGEGNLDELMKKAAEDPMIDDIVSGRKPAEKKPVKLKLEQCSEADKLIEEMEQKIGFWYIDTGILVREKSESGLTNSTDQLLLMLYYAAIKEIERRPKIRNAAMCKFEIDGQVLLKYDSNGQICLGNNALHAIYLAYQDAKDLARTVISAIEDQIDFDIGFELFSSAADTRLRYVSDNSWMALAYLSIGKHEKAKTMLPAINNLKEHEMQMQLYRVEDYTALATLNYIIGDVTGGERELEKAEAIFHSKKPHNFAKDYLSLAIAYMARQGYNESTRK